MISFMECSARSNGQLAWMRALEAHQPVDDAYDWFVDNAEQIEHARRQFLVGFRNEALCTLVGLR